MMRLRHWINNRVMRKLTCSPALSGQSLGVGMLQESKMQWV